MGAMISYYPRTLEYSLQVWAGKGKPPIEVFFKDLLTLLSYCEMQEIEVNENNLNDKALSVSDTVIFLDCKKRALHFDELVDLLVYALTERETKELMQSFEQRKREVLSGKGR